MHIVASLKTYFLKIRLRLDIIFSKYKTTNEIYKYFHTFVVILYNFYTLKQLATVHPMPRKLTGNLDSY